MQIANDTPRLQLQTLFIIDERKRIVSTRAARPWPGPALIIIRGTSTVAWAIHATVPNSIAEKVTTLASEEKPSEDWHEPLRHHEQYVKLLNARLRAGPAFTFPDHHQPSGPLSLTEVENEAELNHHFKGWQPGEIAEGCAPVIAVCEASLPISVCFSARRSSAAAEAGIETATPFRGKGYAPRVANAWAQRIRAEGLLPLYSTDWSNHASLAVARKLLLVQYAVDFSFDS